jgi:adenylate cyclase
MVTLRSLAHYIIRAKWAQYAAVTLVAAASAALVSRFSALDAVEAFTQDVRVANLSAPSAPEPGIVIVAITERTLDGFAYRSPIDRRFLARLLESIAAQHPKAIGIDVLFDRPSDARSDRVLRETLSRHGASIVLAAPSQDGAALRPESRAFWRSYSAAAPSGDGALILSRRDRTVRSQIPAAADGAPNSFAAMLAARAGARLPRGEIIIPFRRAAESPEQWPFPTYDAEHVEDMPAELGWFTNKIVLVGALFESEDRFATPMRLAPGAAETTPGVVVHAYQVAQLIDGVAPRRAPFVVALMLTFAAAAAGQWAGATLLDWRLLTLTLSAMGFIYAAATFAAYAGLGLLAPMVAPCIAIMFGGAGGAAVSARQNARGRRALDQAFRHYLAPEVVDEIMRRPERFNIDGDEREISILVTDIEGFTAMLGRADARALAGTINSYFDALIDAVIAHGGAVDKIVGDGVFALFGAPVRRADHAERAVQCALAMDAIGERFRRMQGAVPFGRTRIGVSSGVALVGSFGGARRINYTAYGSVVNLADRLQGASKAIGTRALISAATRALAPELCARPAGRLVLRGAPQIETAFEPCAAGAPIEAYLAAYDALDRRAPDALAQFERLASADPADALAAFHLARLRAGEGGVEIDLR